MLCTRVGYIPDEHEQSHDLRIQCNNAATRKMKKKKNDDFGVKEFPVFQKQIPPEIAASIVARVDRLGSSSQKSAG